LVASFLANSKPPQGSISATASMLGLETHTAGRSKGTRKGRSRPKGRRQAA
jgi:hypothetical protein